MSPATLKRIASDFGGVPRWGKVLAYYSICVELVDGSGKTQAAAAGGMLRTFWVRARKEERGTLAVREPRPEFVHDAADLSHALYALYENEGAPPLRELQCNAGTGALHLPLSTAARIVTRQTLPADTPQFKAFVEGCGVSERDIKAWLAAWYKAMSRPGETTFDIPRRKRNRSIHEEMPEHEPELLHAV
ncbi:hypothetical protein [Streptomyces mirabilis]|uniref:hypothetical protein n=1 Tax=Streptomyces mirabilis TaxID=68239 RepID=UPI0036BE8707